MSRLRVHLSKSALIPISEVLEHYHGAQLFNCEVEYLPLSYDGLLLGAAYESKVVWESNLERLHNRSIEWKSTLLSRWAT